MRWTVSSYCSLPHYNELFQTANVIHKNSEREEIVLELDERLLETYHGVLEGVSEEEYAPLILQHEYEIPLINSFEEKFSYKVISSVDMFGVYQRVSVPRDVSKICR